MAETGRLVAVILQVSDLNRSAMLYRAEDHHRIGLSSSG